MIVCREIWERSTRGPGRVLKWRERGDAPLKELSCNGEGRVHRVTLTFGLWAYRAKVVVTVCGTRRGLPTIDEAVRVAYQMLETAGPYVTLLLEMDNGNALESSDEYSRGEQWLRDILISAEIGTVRELCPKLA